MMGCSSRENSYRGVKFAHDFLLRFSVEISTFFSGREQEGREMETGFLLVSVLASCRGKEKGEGKHKEDCKDSRCLL